MAGLARKPAMVQNAPVWQVLQAKNAKLILMSVQAHHARTTDTVLIKQMITSVTANLPSRDLTARQVFEGITPGLSKLKEFYFFFSSFINLRKGFHQNSKLSFDTAITCFLFFFYLIFLCFTNKLVFSRK